MSNLPTAKQVPIQEELLNACLDYAAAYSGFLQCKDSFPERFVKSLARNVKQCEEAMKDLALAYAHDVEAGADD